MLILQAIIIAIVEGITEFLPVSSTGHMIIVDELLGFKRMTTSGYAEMFEVVIQLGAILAIVVLYWDKIWDSLKHLEEYGFKLWLSVIIGSIPAAVIGLPLNKKIEKYLFNSITVAIGLIVGAILLIYLEKKYRRKATVKRMEDINYGQAFKIGIFQCLALWPGMSRSGSTIMGAWVCGLNNTAAAEFSFFLALPAMVGASGLKLVKADFASYSSNEVIALIIGFIVAFLVALLVVDRFIAFLKKKPMKVFAVYRLAIGFLILMLVAVGFIAIK